MLVFFVHINGFAVVSQVGQWTSEKKVKLEMHHDGRLHVQDILLGIGIIGNLDKVLQQRRINFFIFAGDEQGCDSNQLQLGSVNRVGR